MYEIKINWDQLLDLFKIILSLVAVYLAGYLTHFFKIKLFKRKNISNRTQKEIAKIDEFLEISNLISLDYSNLNILENTGSKINDSLEIVKNSILEKTEQIKDLSIKITNFHRNNETIIKLNNLLDNKAVAKETKAEISKLLDSLEINDEKKQEYIKNLSTIKKDLHNNQQIIEDINDELINSEQLRIKLKGNIEEYEHRMTKLDIEVTSMIIDPNGNLLKNINELMEFAKDEESKLNFIDKKIEIKKILNKSVEKM
jgi:hypothetical protein